MPDPTPPAAPRLCECGHPESRTIVATQEAEPCPDCGHERRVHGWHALIGHACFTLGCDCKRCLADYTRPVSPETAPPRATTPKPMTPESLMLKHSYTSWSELLADAELGASVRAGSPSRDSGALRGTFRGALRRWELALLQRERGTTGESLAEADVAVTNARAALESRLSTLERDAARMREALEYYAKAGAPYAGKVARAALAPSGEPTTTPGSNVQL